MVALLSPVFGLRLDTTDAGNDPANTSSRQAFDLLAQGFGPGFNGPLLLVAELPKRGDVSAMSTISAAVRATGDVAAVTKPRLAPSGNVAVIEAYPKSAPQDAATTDLVNQLRHDVLPPLEQRTSHQGPGRWLHRRLDRLLERAGREAAAVHSDRRDPLGAAAARHVPLDRDRHPGRGDEPAQHRRRARRHGGGVPVGLVREPARRREGADRTVDTGADVRRRVRPVDGLRGVPGLARA